MKFIVSDVVQSADVVVLRESAIGRKVKSGRYLSETSGYLYFVTSVILVLVPLLMTLVVLHNRKVYVAHRTLVVIGKSVHVNVVKVHNLNDVVTVDVVGERQFVNLTVEVLFRLVVLSDVVSTVLVL